MAWKGGEWCPCYGRDEFKAWLRKQAKPTWAQFLTLHNTGAPYTMASVGACQRMKNLAHYYKNLGWSSGPHFFVMGDKVCPATPVSLPGTHSPSWNRTGIAVEVEGDYRSGKHDPKSGAGATAFATAAWVFQELLAWLGWSVDRERVRLHREDPRTTHACPGNLVSKDWFLGLLAPAAVPEPAPSAEPTYWWVTGVPAGDWLNVRSGPGTKFGLVGKLYNGIRVEVLERDPSNWAYVRTPAGYRVWAYGAYLAPIAPSGPEKPQEPSSPVPAIPTPPAPVPPAAPPALPASYDRPEPFGKARAPAAVEWLVARGVPRYKAAAAVGRFQREVYPDLRTTVWGDKGTALGLAQWRGVRLDGMRDFAKEAGTQLGNMWMQLDYFLYEMAGSPEVKLAREAWSAATTLEDAVKAMMHYERPRGYKPTCPECGDGYKETMAFARALL